MNTLNTQGQTLAQRLTDVYAQESEYDAAYAHAEKVNVVGAGGTLTAAYEQLRNAAENTEEHLLLQNAIRRFYRQLFITRDDNLVHQSGNELAVELTLAGYIANDSLTQTQLDEISQLAIRYYNGYVKLQQYKGVSQDRGTKWMLDVLAVEVETLINNHARETLFVDFAHTQLAAMINDTALFGKPVDDFDAALYVAIYFALLKSDAAVARTVLLRRYNIPVENLDQYVTLNKQIDKLVGSDVVDKLRRVVDRQGAPLRILRHMIDDTPDLNTLLARHDAFLGAYENTINDEYARVAKRVNRAIVRSVIFLIITKFLIGIGIEVPYDLWVYGSIIWLPLIINLFFPPLYMIALRATHRLPGYANTTALVERIDTMMYGERTSLTRSRLSGKKYSMAFSVVYVAISFLIFSAVMYGLLLLDFSLLHILIFFVFLSAASFLGFRLSRSIREIEVVRAEQNGMTFVRDVVYMPFVVVGQWMSDKYSRVNIVTIILDMLIELPLKTVLRLMRQWAAFIDDRKDRI